MHYVNVVGHDPMVVAFGSRDRRFITNPYCCAVPRPNGQHVVLDMATTTVAAGKVRVAHMKRARLFPANPSWMKMDWKPLTPASFLAATLQVPCSLLADIKVTD